VTLPAPAEIRIERLGSDGDGVGELPSGERVYVPFTLPGELVEIRPTGKRGEGFACSVDRIVEVSPHRVRPECLHFGVCGGCSLQHYALAEYLAWKANLLSAALRRAGFAPEAAPIVQTPPYQRRRMDLAIRREIGLRQGGVTLGLHAARDQTVIDITECHVLHPTLFKLIEPLRGLLRGLNALGREGSAIVNLLDSGPDLLLRTDRPLSVVDRTRLAAFAREHGLPRVMWAQNTGIPETAALLRPAVTNFSGTAVIPPAGGFLQASRPGEAAIIEAVLAGLPAKSTPKSRVLELYAGSGTLTFAIEQKMRVHAVEGDTVASAALKSAANASGKTGRITVEQRDLQRRPLSAKEIDAFAVVVLDPPHGGAETQTAQIAASKVKRVIYVSCNPGALARDALMLKQAGFKLESCVPVDQFLWSARLESVSVFVR
jgi:23S rRNA (uracil1939-C5)-methyltransferase